jgi:hypothetical protein
MNQNRPLNYLFQTTIFLFFSLLVFSFQAQTFTQTVKGRVLDQDTKTPLIGAKVILLNTEPL